MDKKMTAKDTNPYGAGRLSVIRELETFIEKEVAKIKQRGRPSDIPTRATLSGVLSGYNRIRLQLEKKKEAFLKHDI